MAFIHDNNTKYKKMLTILYETILIENVCSNFCFNEFIKLTFTEEQK